ncbi:hypothetical protein QE435_000515 [Rhizobium sp. SORGH_AS 787]|nr:hypothetical protein [Rhizobium sp. SORGH_AS_0787]
MGLVTELIKPGYPQQNGRHDRDIIVTNCGRACLYHKKINTHSARVETRCAGDAVSFGCCGLWCGHLP